MDNRQDEENEEDIDEDEVIDVAEQIFIRIAQTIVAKQISSIRDVFEDQIVHAQSADGIVELMLPEGLIESLQNIGIDDLTEKEERYLLRVLTKPELDNAIVLDELLQIMGNLGLYDGDDEYGHGQDESPDGRYNEDEEQYSDFERDASPESMDMEGKNRKSKEALDLSKLDEKSVKIMVMLMVNLLQLNMTTHEFFREVCFEQKIQTKTKQFSLMLIRSEDFFRVLQERGIRKKNNEHANLREFLQLNNDNSDLLLLKNVKKTLELMS